ncbi:MAG: hypothetical protein QM734_02850 [Cyclobacteriaceae bacterium]
MKTLFVYFVAMSYTCFAQTTDPLFPKVGKFNAGIISTYTGNPPPVAILDLTYGVGKKFSVGIVGGTTGTQALAGLKINTVIFQKENFRGLFKWNAIYYPGRDGKFLMDNSIQHVMPWMFTMGIADVEWKTKNGTRWSIGGGYLETHCIDGMLKMMHLASDDDDKTDLPLQFYNVLHGGVSIPVTKKIFIRPEVVVVMHGFEVIQKTKDSKVSPVNPYFNLVYSF